MHLNRGQLTGRRTMTTLSIASRMLTRLLITRLLGSETGKNIFILQLIERHTLALSTVVLFSTIR